MDQFIRNLEERGELDELVQKLHEMKAMDFLKSIEEEMDSKQ